MVDASSSPWRISVNSYSGTVDLRLGGHLVVNPSAAPWHWRGAHRAQRPSGFQGDVSPSVGSDETLEMPDVLRDDQPSDQESLSRQDRISVQRFRSGRR